LHIYDYNPFLVTIRHVGSNGGFSLFSITNAWHYEQAKSLDGVNWQSKAFNDSTWPSGVGLLYFEDIRRPLLRATHY
jgi:hypothetical protein